MSDPKTNGAETVTRAALSDIIRSPWNRTVDPKALDPKFVANIGEHGIIQPLIVRLVPHATDPGKYELVAGERRLVAAHLNQLETVPVIVRELSDTQAIEVQKIENLQREGLNPLEEAEGYEQLIAAYGAEGMGREKAIEHLATKLSRGKSTIYEALKLLKLPQPVAAAVAAGTLPTSHAGLIAKLPEALQAEMARAIAPGKPLSRKEEDELERQIGYVENARDEKTGLVSFRDARELVDDLVERAKRAEQYEKKAVAFREKGGTALTFVEARAAGDSLSMGDYLNDYRGYVRDVIKGVKELPAMIMQPMQHRESEPEMVYRKSELLAALKKAGVKPRSYGGGGGSSVNYAKRERERQARERVQKSILSRVIDPIRAAAGKRTAKIPWPLLLGNVADWNVQELCKRRGWKSDYRNAGEVLAAQVAKMPENQMAGVVADFLIGKLTTAHTGAYQSGLVELGTFYGVDVKAIAKSGREQLAPAAKKTPAIKLSNTAAYLRQRANAVQASGTPKKRAKPSAATRAKIAAALKKTKAVAA